MSDKRSVHTDALATLGTIIDETAARDAIHLAVEPVVAAETLYPGQHIGLGNEGATTNGVKLLGIVDPFIMGPVHKGQKFWLIVYPRTITSLRHVWTHPDFETMIDQKSLSEQWLRQFCESNDCPDYNTVLGAFLSGDADGKYLHFEGHDAHGSIPNEFWNHMENVTGQKITNRPEYFSCSC
jgi:hypothetical protein